MDNTTPRRGTFLTEGGGASKEAFDQSVHSPRKRPAGAVSLLRNLILTRPSVEWKMTIKLAVRGQRKPCSTFGRKPQFIYRKGTLRWNIAHHFPPENFLLLSVTWIGTGTWFHLSLLFHPSSIPLIHVSHFISFETCSFFFSSSSSVYMEFFLNVSLGICKTLKSDSQPFFPQYMETLTIPHMG